MRATPRRELEPLETCPAKWRELITGECRSCGRRVAPARKMARVPELRRWCLSALNTTTCKTCAGRPRDRERVRRLAVKELQRLRALVGACMACGWFPGIAEGPHDCADARVSVSDANDRECAA